LPAAILAGVAASGEVHPAHSNASGSGPRWLLAAGALALLVTGAALVYGAVATPARHWDGFVAWELKATVLAAAPTLEQPFFADHAVFAHSRDYPLLQPLVQSVLQRIAGAPAGRLLFVALWVLLVALVFLTVQRAGQPARDGCLAALGLGLLPMLVSPTSGSVDSGYAELFVLLALTSAGAGLLLADAALLGASCALLILLKPEGAVYAPAIVLCAWRSRERRLLRGAVTGSVLAGLVWLPVFNFLRLGPPAGAHAPWLGWGAVLALGGLVLVTQSANPQSAPQVHARRARWLVAAAAAAAAGWVLLAAGPRGGALFAYLDSVAHLGERAARVPALLLALGEHAFSPRRYGLLIPLLLCAWLARERAAAPRAARLLALLLVLGGLIVSAAMVLAPEPDFDHHVRSSLDRLLLQWSGVATLCVATWLRAPFQDNARTMPSP
jgi:hypothetical protein